MVPLDQIEFSESDCLQQRKIIVLFYIFIENLIQQMVIFGNGLMNYDPSKQSFRISIVCDIDSMTSKCVDNEQVPFQDGL